MSEFDLEQMGDAKMMAMITPPWWLKVIGFVGFFGCLSMLASVGQGAA